MSLNKTFLIHRYSRTSIATLRSPVELEIDLKQKEIILKEKEVDILYDKYDSKVREYNPNIYTDTSKTFCMQ